MKTKNTRLVYTDEKNLKVYESLPSEDFKEFFMTYFTYQDGDDVSKTISNPFVQTLFMAAYADKIKYNEEKWENRAKSNKENGKKGGRPRKNNTDLEPNTEFETVVKISPNEAEIDADEAEVPQEEESLPEAAGMAEYEVVITDINNTGMGTYIGTLNELSFREVMPETRRVEQEESIDKSMEHIMKCLSVLDINKAKHQVFKSRSIDENMKRVADCLDPLLGGFSQTDRSRFYISLVEEVLNN